MTSNEAMARVAIVTGGGRGMGREIVLGLASAGIHVVATAARERLEIEAVAEEARRLRPDRVVLPIIADVSREEECEAAVAATIARFGKLDILINNAGRGMKYVSKDFLSQPTRFWEVEPETWRMVVDTNVNGPFFMARRAAPLMIEAGWGRIINISMNHETMRRAGFSPYGPSKAALESETIIWSHDLAGTGVTVNALLPGGATRTGMIPDELSEERRAALLDPAIVVPPLLWLVSTESDEFTGQRLTASQWRMENDPRKAAEAASAPSGWAVA
jgi:NAD(P)-dependent dehydrogenase (short-subunit alcohol dehydrogenase family)